MTTPIDIAKDRAERMMEALGLDPDELRMRAILRDQEFIRIAEKCAGCDQISECEDWLSGQPSRASEAPEYCRNKFLFDVLTS